MHTTTVNPIMYMPTAHPSVVLFMFNWRNFNQQNDSVPDQARYVHRVLQGISVRGIAGIGSKKTPENTC